MGIDIYDKKQIKDNLNMILVGKFYDSIICDVFENIPLKESLT